MYYLIYINTAFEYLSLGATLLFRFTLSLVFSVPLVCYAVNSQINSEQYLGAGLARFSIKSDHPSINDQSISGVSLIYGVRSYNHVFELALGGGGGVEVDPTYDIYYPEDTADYGYFSLSYHYHFRNFIGSSGVVPYLGAGYSFNSINWQSYVYDHSGEGYSVIVGALFPIEKNWSLNASYTRLSYSGEKLLFSFGDYQNYDTRVSEMALKLVYHFY